MVGGEVRPTLVVAALLVGVFAVCHGRVHGTELPAGQRGLLYSMGFVSATGCLHGLGIALGLLPPLAGRYTGPARRRRAHCGHGRVVPMEGHDMSRGDHQPTWRVALAVGGALLLWPWRAEAHLVTTGLGPVYDGIGHLLVTPEELLQVLALALCAGLCGTGSGRYVLSVLSSAWLVGGCVGLLARGLPAFPMPALSLLLLGTLVAADLRLPPAVVTALAGGLGLEHGCLNGVAMRQAGVGALGLLGIMAALVVLVALVAACVVALQQRWRRIVVRVAGSWIAAIGLLMPGWILRGGP
jgi:urease accessory protein